MSGGAFNYQQHHIRDIANQIEDLIYHNGSEERDVHGGPMHPSYPPDVIARFQEAVEALERAYVYAQRVDWLVSGDDGIGSFKLRLAEDLAKLKQVT